MTTENKSKPALLAFDNLEFSPRFEYGDQAKVVEISGTGQGTELGTGFGRFTDATIPWTIKYDEVLLVIEGEVTVETSSGSFTARPRDCIWLPKGTELTYRAESALVYYAIHPANWAE